MNALTLNFYPIRLSTGEYTTAFFDGEDFFVHGKPVNHPQLLAFNPNAIAPSASGKPANLDALAKCAKWVYLRADSKNHPRTRFTPLPFMLHDNPAHHDVIYLNQALDILRRGHYSTNRTGVDAINLNSGRAEFDFRKGAPLPTTKFMSAKNAFSEMKWMLSGESNIFPLQADGCNIWNEWATKLGELGPVYGKMWRHWPDRRAVFKSSAQATADIKTLRDRNFATEYENDDIAVLYREVDQVANALRDLVSNPTNRRIRITGLNPSYTPYDDLTPVENAEIGQQALSPCHILYHLLTAPIPHHERAAIAGKPSATAAELDALNIPKLYVDMNLYQGSCDFFLGCPYNRFNAFCMMNALGSLSNTVPRHFVHDTGSTHIYINHIKQILTQMDQPIGAIPTARVHVTSLAEVSNAWVEVKGYKPGIKLQGAVAV